MSPHTRHIQFATGSIALVVLMFFSINILISDLGKSWKWDLTEDKIFTLSDSTRSVLGDLDEPIIVRLFFSRTLGERAPVLAIYHARVKAVLEQYAALSGDKLVLEYFDPEPFSETEDRALAFGLQGLPLSEAGDNAYFGLAASNSTDDSEVIAFLSQDREEFLEYDLTRLVHNLADPDKPVLGILSTVPLLGTQQNDRPLAFMDQVLEFFDVRFLLPDDAEIPVDVDVMMIVHPHDIPDAMLYSIDQFVLRGGRALVFVDPYAELDTLLAVQPGTEPGASDFNRMLNAWGVHLVEGVIAADIDNARAVSFAQNGQMMSVDYVAWLAMVSRNFDPDDTIMSELDGINLATSGVLDLVEGTRASLQPLIFTGPRSMRLDVAEFGVELEVVKLFRDFKPSGTLNVLAARISGDVTTAFPDYQEPEHLSTSAKPTNLIVIADVDLLHDRFWVERRDMMGQEIQVPLANNGDFVLNALENLSGSPALIALRGRGTAYRPFVMVEEIRLEAERQFRAKEQELQTSLKAAEARFSDLIKRANADVNLILSDEDQRALDDVRTQILEIRRGLRTVQHDLRADIDRLEGWLKFLNIGAVPVALGLGIILFMMVRRREKKAGRA
ncbi:MAG: ABC transporter [Rhodospirillales bacterium]|nr:ABC transporter [Rhodospirillales bacterium]